MRSGWLRDIGQILWWLFDRVTRNLNVNPIFWLGKGCEWIPTQERFYPSRYRGQFLDSEANTADDTLEVALRPFYNCLSMFAFPLRKKPNLEWSPTRWFCSPCIGLWLFVEVWSWCNHHRYFIEDVNSSWTFIWSTDSKCLGAQNWWLHVQINHCWCFQSAL